MRQKQRKEQDVEDMIPVSAKLLGVSKPTLRRWDGIEKFKARRPQINAYRRYLRDDAMKLRKRILEGERAP
jgi:DNA-binding transcriptional MerR regulator